MYLPLPHPPPHVHQLIVSLFHSLPSIIPLHLLIIFFFLVIFFLLLLLLRLLLLPLLFSYYYYYSFLLPSVHLVLLFSIALLFTPLFLSLLLPLLLPLLLSLLLSLFLSSLLLLLLYYFCCSSSFYYYCSTYYSSFLFLRVSVYTVSSAWPLFTKVEMYLWFIFSSSLLFLIKSTSHVCCICNITSFLKSVKCHNFKHDLTAFDFFNKQSKIGH